MKEKILKILSKPKIVISVGLFVGACVIAFGYNRVGKAPMVDVNIDNGSIVSGKGDVINLSFLKPGRISDVLVKEGQEVHKGDVLVKLDAPDQEGVLAQAKSNLNLATAQFVSLNNQYANTQKQQDLIVQNAYNVLLSGGLEGVPDDQTASSMIVSGNYTCGKEGFYKLELYRSSDNDSGYSFKYSGLENGVASVKFENSVALGDCGLQVRFNENNFSGDVDWMINVPNTKSSVYLTNKNAYELAKENRAKVLDELLTNIGKTDKDNSVARAQVEAARGAYEAALGAYKNNLIIAPTDGVITFVDKNLILGQSVTAGKNVISITVK